jgi:hypothetical protein
MRKFATIIILLLFTCVNVFAQAYESKIDFSKKKQEAFAIDLPYATEAVENAIDQRMEKLGYRTREEKGIFNKDKGFRIYRNASITEISNESYDYIVKVEQKTRKDKATSTLYIVIQKNGTNARNSFAGSEAERARRFLENLAPDVEAADLEIQIRTQEEIISKAEKKFKGLQDDKASMEDKIRKLRDDIKVNETDQNSTQIEITNQKIALETLRGKRSN